MYHLIQRTVWLVLPNRSIAAGKIHFDTPLFAIVFAILDLKKNRRNYKKKKRRGIIREFDLLIEQRKSKNRACDYDERLAITEAANARTNIARTSFVKFPPL